MKAAEAAAVVSQSKNLLVNPSDVLNAAWHSVSQVFVTRILVILRPFLISVGGVRRLLLVAQLHV